ncbi:MAG: NAD(P)H-dependent oxidoreductase subunit E [Ferruginibacter sp.]|nr:NAD(P)H-dependent oxidoreductase subunit E [Cytophagales bacterium]
MEDVKFPDATHRVVQQIIGRYPEGRQKSALLPVLHLAQAEWGWLSPAVMDHVAGLLGIQPIEVYEVATFYTMFHLQPTGKYVLEVCRTGPCCLLGAEDLIEHLENKLNIRVGETSADGLFTLKTVECLAACGYAPVLQVQLPEPGASSNSTYRYFENLTEEKVDEMMETLARR